MVGLLQTDVIDIGKISSIPIAPPYIVEIDDLPLRKFKTQLNICAHQIETNNGIGTNFFEGHSFWVT